jgi:hypothetical protein
MLQPTQYLADFVWLHLVSEVQLQDSVSIPRIRMVGRLAMSLGLTTSRNRAKLWVGVDLKPHTSIAHTCVAYFGAHDPHEGIPAGHALEGVVKDHWFLADWAAGVDLTPGEEALVTTCHLTRDRPDFATASPLCRFRLAFTVHLQADYARLW